MMDWNTILFLIFPYLAMMTAAVGVVYRAIFRPFTVSSLSSQLLERKKLYWGSISFHWGIVVILLGHLAALFLPNTIAAWNAQPLRLYLLELTGLALAFWSLGGLLILTWRRLSERRVRAVTSPMDGIVLALLLVSVITGIWTAVGYRFGSTWFTAVFTPYLWSLLTFQPQTALVAPLPFVIKLHVINFFALLFAFPFSRLVHIVTYPLGYLFRPWQIVVRARGGAVETVGRG